jgi:PAT family beta-lactamase induction signal transducer AmpG
MIPGVPRLARRWLESLGVYRDPRNFRLLLLNISCGVPYLVTASTLSLWLKEYGISLAAIGLFSLVAVPYSLKFVWAPLVDRLPLPWLTRRLGRRRSWMLLAQVGLVAAILVMGSLDPGRQVGAVAAAALVVAFLAATQDIVVDAYRVEVLEPEQQGAGAGVAVLGYRLGMLISGAGALAIAQLMSWHAAFVMMAGVMGLGMMTALLSPEPARRTTAAAQAREARGAAYLAARPAVPLWLRRPLAWAYAAVVCPFADFMSRPGWVIILLFVMLYRFDFSLAGVMANPFYIAVGFTKLEIAAVSKIFGLVATIAGALLGGVLVPRLGLYRALLLAGILQGLSNLMFVAQAVVGHSVPLLTLTIAIDNLSGGMAGAVLVAYVSSLCNPAYTGTQYALLMSFASFARTVLCSPAGVLAEWLGWAGFYLLATAAALPGLALLAWLMHRATAAAPPSAAVATGRAS